VAKFVRTQKSHLMETSTDRKPLYVKYGELSLQLMVGIFKLNVYKNIELSKRRNYKDYLFLPFSDLTSSRIVTLAEIYRFKIPKGDTIVIDFNTSHIIVLRV
jgi:hypothetical protein